MDLGLQGKNVLVIGGSAGIGRAVAEVLAEAAVAAAWERYFQAGLMSAVRTLRVARHRF